MEKIMLQTKYVKPYKIKIILRKNDNKNEKLIRDIIEECNWREDFSYYQGLQNGYDQGYRDAIARVTEVL